MKQFLIAISLVFSFNASASMSVIETTDQWDDKDQLMVIKQDPNSFVIPEAIMFQLEEGNLYFGYMSGQLCVTFGNTDTAKYRIDSNDTVTLPMVFPSQSKGFGLIDSNNRDEMIQLLEQLIGAKEIIIKQDSCEKTSTFKINNNDKAKEALNKMLNHLKA